MNKIQINNFNNSNGLRNIYSPVYNYLYNKSFSIFLIINSFFTLYLFFQNNRINSSLNELLITQSKLKNDVEFFKKRINMNTVNKDAKIDFDMIGLKYPDILYDKIKDDFQNGKIFTSFYDFLTQLEEKLLYLEKEINVTKLNAFYTARTLYLQKNNVPYDDSQIIQYHNIISWLVIHKSTQLKGIASDKYLACKYVKMKTGQNLCPQRIGVYNNVEEIDFENLTKTGDLILKISNGCHDSVYIEKNNSKDYSQELKKNVTYFFNRDYTLIVPEFFHSYSKKRIILEKVFSPKEELYEFKILIFNNEIKMIYLLSNINKKSMTYYFDQYFEPIEDGNHQSFNLLNIFDKNILDRMKTLALELSEDFPNFIRVDLYIFQNNIYLSEMTFDSHEGKPYFTNIKYFHDGLKNWKRVDY